MTPATISRQGLLGLRAFDDRLASTLTRVIHHRLGGDVPSPVTENLADYYHLFRGAFYESGAAGDKSAAAENGHSSSSGTTAASSGIDAVRTPVGGLRQLVTHHQTVVFLDVVGNELRHGPASCSPRNAFLTSNEATATARLAYVSADGGLSAISVASGPTIAAVKLHDPTTGEPPPLSVISRERGVIGLLSDGLYLCAERDGRITLSRQQFMVHGSDFH